MSELSEKLLSTKDLVHLSPVSEEQIKDAEKKLNLKFSLEYRSYVSEFGVASADGYELTGICNSPRLNVVDVTISERENNPDVPKDWYVLEQANIDGIVIWQNQKGEVYQTQPCRENKMIANSIVEYISMKQH